VFDFSIFRVRRQQTPKELRIGGALMIAMGLFIAAGGVAFGWLLLDLPIPAHWLPAGTRIVRDPASEGLSGFQKAALAAITLAFLTFGTASIVQGGLQLVLARQNKALLRLMIVIALLFAVAGVIAAAVLGRPIGRTGQ
jgi:Na+/proline symporter